MCLVFIWLLMRSSSRSRCPITHLRLILPNRSSSSHPVACQMSRRSLRRCPASSPDRSPTEWWMQHTQKSSKGLLAGRFTPSSSVRIHNVFAPNDFSSSSSLLVGESFGVEVTVVAQRRSSGAAEGWLSAFRRSTMSWWEPACATDRAVCPFCARGGRKNSGSLNCCSNRFPPDGGSVVSL